MSLKSSNTVTEKRPSCEEDSLKGKILYGPVRHSQASKWVEGQLGSAWLSSPSERSPLAEKFQSIKRQILLKNPKTRLLQITSSLPEEGKSPCAYNLALSLSLERDFTVCLVDAGAGDHPLSARLGYSDQPGFNELLLDPTRDLASMWHSMTFENISLLPGGQAFSHRTERLASEQFKHWLNGVQQQFPNTLFVFDTGPLLKNNESQMMAQVVDQVLLVVNQGKTPQDQVKKAIDKIPEAKRAGSILLNNI